MKIQTSRQQGSALMIALITSAIMGITLMSYLSMTSAQNRSVTRAQSWNSVIPLAEAGVEEALAQLYYNSTNLGANGWTASGNVFTKTRTVGDGRYIASISNCNPPVIYSTGRVQVPLQTNELARTIKVNTVGGPLFAKGMVAKANIAWSGNIVSDSFDSTDPNYSTGGRYDSAKRKDGGSVASNSGSISLSGGTIYGSVATGLAGSVTGGTVGDSNFVASGGTGIESGHYNNDMNISFADSTVPFTSGYFTGLDPGIIILSTNNLSLVTTTTYDYSLLQGDYKLSGLPGGKTIYVVGNVRVYFPNGFQMSSSSGITLGPKASLQIYSGGDVSVSGQGVMNGTGNALNCSLYGLPGCSSIAFGGNAAFTGTIYAPEATLSASGGGNDNYDLVGAVIVGAVNMSGHFNFHYDESLARTGPRKAYIVTSWNEI